MLQKYRYQSNFNKVIFISYYKYIYYFYKKVSRNSYF